MKEQKIEVTINDDGTTKIEGFGFEGNACLKETESLEEALGKVVSRTKKSEAHHINVGDKTKVGQ